VTRGFEHGASQALSPTPTAPRKWRRVVRQKLDQPALRVNRTSVRVSPLWRGHEGIYRRGRLVLPLVTISTLSSQAERMLAAAPVRTAAMKRARVDTSRLPLICEFKYGPRNDVRSRLHGAANVSERSLRSHARRKAFRSWWTTHSFVPLGPLNVPDSATTRPELFLARPGDNGGRRPELRIGSGGRCVAGGTIPADRSFAIALEESYTPPRLTDHLRLVLGNRQV
jgi:hypothetical protein